MTNLRTEAREALTALRRAMTFAKAEQKAWASHRRHPLTVTGQKELQRAILNGDKASANFKLVEEFLIRLL